MQGSESAPTYREISKLRDKHRALEMKEHRLKSAISGFMAYSAISYILNAALSYSSSPIDAGFGFFLSILFSFAFYRVWIKDDSRMWPVAVPSGIVILVSGIVAFISAMAIIPVVLHSVVIFLVYLRKKAIAKVANSSFKRTAAPEI